MKSRYSDFFLDRFKTLFCNDKDNAQQIEELEDDLAEKRSKILSFILNIRSQLNFSQNDNNDCDYFKHYKEKFFSEKIILLKVVLLDGICSFFLQMLVWTRV